MHLCPGRRVERPVDGVVIVIEPGALGIGLAGLRPHLDPGARRLATGVNPGRNAGQQRGAISRTLIGRGSDDRAAENVGQQLAPEITSGAAPGRADLGWHGGAGRKAGPGWGGVRATGQPRTSASSWRQKSLRAPPPVARIWVGTVPI